ncbi:hypothetical protein BHE74_00021881 [Ensete ventricosum]|nr:hypothetical protein BHE74_00021881 [Ensete ventricosum]
MFYLIEVRVTAPSAVRKPYGLVLPKARHTSCHCLSWERGDRRKEHVVFAALDDAADLIRCRILGVGLSKRSGFDAPS